MGQTLNANYYCKFSACPLPATSPKPSTPLQTSSLLTSALKPKSPLNHQSRAFATLLRTLRYHFGFWSAAEKPVPIGSVASALFCPIPENYGCDPEAFKLASYVRTVINNPAAAHPTNPILNAELVYFISLGVLLVDRLSLALEKESYHRASSLPEQRKTASHPCNPSSSPQPQEARAAHASRPRKLHLHGRAS
jgi:hypothetical protein